MVSILIVTALLIARLVVVPWLLGPSARRRGGPEALLYADLAAGRITREQYRCGMAEVAARDAVRSPLVVPPER